eukprot:scaffold1090_cov135-Isochrysis_galbana.AAC.2
MGRPQRGRPVPDTSGLDWRRRSRPSRSSQASQQAPRASSSKLLKGEPQPRRAVTPAAPAARRPPPDKLRMACASNARCRWPPPPLGWASPVDRGALAITR